MKRYTKKITDTISAENTYSDSDKAVNTYIKGDFNFMLSGTWVATVYLQRSFDGDSTWYDVDSFTTNISKAGMEPEGAYYRFGVKTGGYTSGNVAGRISQNTIVQRL